MLGLLGGWLIACGPTVPPTTGDGTGSSSHTGGGQTTGMVADGTTSGSSSGRSSESTYGAFIMEPDGGALCGPVSGAICPCNLIGNGWCAEGYKCVPWANDGGGIWNDTRCVPVEPRPAAVGEPCHTEGGPTSGFDDCDAESICLFHDARSDGRCVPKCGGTPAEPMCGRGEECFVGFDGAMSVCLAPCDPLAAECAEGTCIPNDDDGFVCFPAVPPSSSLGESCEVDSQCPPQSVCVTERGPGWCGSGECTCTSLCDLLGMPPEASCAVGRACMPWFAPGSEPAGLEHVGFCL